MTKTATLAGKCPTCLHGTTFHFVGHQDVPRECWELIGNKVIPLYNCACCGSTLSGRRLVSEGWAREA